MNKKIITAHIDDEMRFQIEYLKHNLREKSTTQILTRAVHNLYNSVKELEAKHSSF